MLEDYTIVIVNHNLQSASTMNSAERSVFILEHYVQTR